MRFALLTSLVLSLAALVCLPVTADEPKKPPAHLVQVAPKDLSDYLQAISVTVSAGTASGSGCLVSTTDGTTWVWTAGHVVSHLRTVRKVGDSTGGTKNIVEFEDAKVVQINVQDGRKVRESSWLAETIRYSNADFGEDLALLRLREKDVKATSTVFYQDEAVPKLATKIFHCGSLLGQEGAQSITEGIISQHGRLINKVVYDQSTATAFPGSSGGPICLSDGRYIGMLVRGAGETFNFYVPIRRMKAWAKRVGVEFALNPNVTVPSEDVLKRAAIDDEPVLPSGGFDRMPPADLPEHAFKIYIRK